MLGSTIWLGCSSNLWRGIQSIKGSVKQLLHSWRRSESRFFDFLIYLFFLEPTEQVSDAHEVMSHFYEWFAALWQSQALRHITASSLSHAASCAFCVLRWPRPSCYFVTGWLTWLSDKMSISFLPYSRFNRFTTFFFACADHGKILWSGLEAHSSGQIFQMWTNLCFCNVWISSAVFSAI